MWATFIAGLRARRRRLIGTSLAVVIGVAFLTATLIVADTMRTGFGAQVADGNAGVDVVIRNSTVIGANVDRTRGTIDAGVLDLIAQLPGVATAAPHVEGVGQIVGADGALLGGQGPPTRAVNWIEDPELNPYRIIDGRAPAAAGEVVIDRGSAADGDLEVGSITTVRVPQPIGVRVVGIAVLTRASGDDLDGETGATYVAMTTTAAQNVLLGTPDALTSVLLRAEPGVTPEELRDIVAEVLPPNAEALTGAELTADERAQLESDFLSVVRVFLLVFAGIALLVATFSIHNTFTILVSQRTRETALLRTVGASRRQVLGSLTAEALLVGIVASIAGLGAGIVLGAGLTALLESFGLEMGVSGVVVTSGAVLLALAVGVLVTLVAGTAPALRSSRIAPIAALRDVAIDQTGSRRLRAVLGWLLLGTGATTTALAPRSDDGALGLVGLGGSLVVIGALSLGPVVARTVAGVLGAPVAVLRGPTGRIARQNAMRNPRRTAASASALVVGVAVVALFATFAASIKTSIDESVDRSFAGDLVIVQESLSGSGIDPGLVVALRSLPEVGTAAAMSNVVATTTGRSGTETILPTAVEPAALAALFDLGVSAGSLTEMRAGEVALSERFAEERDLALGDQLPMSFADGDTIRLHVVALYDVSDIVGSIVMTVDDWEPHAVRRSDVAVLVDFIDGIEPDSGRAAVEAVAARFGAPDPQDRDEYVASVAGEIDAVLTLVYGLLGLAVLIGLMGIANTLALSIHDRRRELGLLRAIGQTRSQVRSGVRWESVIIALFGTISGLVLGTFLGWGLVRAVAAQEGFGTFELPTGSLVVIAALAAIAGVLAAWRPARRAARLDILDAIAAV